MSARICACGGINSAIILKEENQPETNARQMANLMLRNFIADNAIKTTLQTLEIKAAMNEMASPVLAVAFIHRRCLRAANASPGTTAIHPHKGRKPSSQSGLKRPAKTP